MTGGLVARLKALMAQGLPQLAELVFLEDQLRAELGEFGNTVTAMYLGAVLSLMECRRSIDEDRTEDAQHALRCLDFFIANLPAIADIDIDD